MKTPQLFLSFLASAAFLVASNLNAATTEPVGYVTKDISSGYNPIGVTFVKPTLHAGVIDSTTDNTITLTSSPNLEAGAYYLEITSSSAELVGDRIDIESVSGNTITLDLTAVHNTLDSATSIPVGTALNIRPHFTIGDFDELISSNINSDDAFDSSTSDLILLFVEGEGLKTHLNYEGVWYENFGDFNIATNKIIAPGTGFFFYRNPNAGTPSSFSVAFTGTVRMNNFVQRLRPGYQFVANGYPLEASPTDFSYNDVLEASENFEATESDLLLTWDGSLKTHLLYDDGTGTKSWYENFGDFNQVDSTNLLTASNAMFIFIKDTGHILEIVRPF